MSTFNSNEMAPFFAVPPDRPRVTDFGGNIRAQHATIDCNGQLANSTFRIARLPRGARVLGFLITASVSLGATQFSIGVAGDGRYRASAPFTTVGTPTFSVFPAAILLSNNAQSIQFPLPSETDISILTSSGNLPAAPNTIDIVTIYTVD